MRRGVVGEGGDLRLQEHFPIDSMTRWILLGIYHQVCFGRYLYVFPIKI